MVVRSGGSERLFNLRIFIGLIKEIRMKLDYTLAGIMPDKVEREMNFGLEDYLQKGNEK